MTVNCGSNLLPAPAYASRRSRTLEVATTLRRIITCTNSHGWGTPPARRTQSWFYPRQAEPFPGGHVADALVRDVRLHRTDDRARRTRVLGDRQAPVPVGLRQHGLDRSGHVFKIGR